MVTVELLNNMLEDIRAHKRNKQPLLERYIQQRLDMSLVNYYADLMQTYSFLSHKNAKNTLKKLTRGDQ